MRLRLTLAGSLIGGLIVWACGDGATTTSTGEQQRPPTVASVAVTPPSATLVSLGETAQLTASAQDASGNTISGKTFTWSSADVNVAMVNTSGLVTAVANGSVTITATTDGVNGTAAVGVDQVGTQLAFTLEPTTTIAGSSIMPAVQVAIQDALGNLVAGVTDAVTMAIGTSPGGGTLSGTATVNAVAGVASFTDLTVDQAGIGYTLAATSGSLSSATSAAFSILPPVPDQIITVQGASSLPEFASQTVVVRFLVEGSPMPNLQFRATVQIGLGTVDPRSGFTDANGEASVVWTFGPAGAQRLVVDHLTESGGSIGASFNTSTPGTAPGEVARFVQCLDPVDDQWKFSGSCGLGEHAAGSTIQVTFRTLGADAATIVPVAAMLFRVDPGCLGTCNTPGGLVSPAEAFTDANGEIAINWTLSPTPGANRLEALIAPEAFGGVGVWTTGN